MKNKFFTIFVAALLPILSTRLFSAETNSTTAAPAASVAVNPIESDLNDLITRINARLKQNKPTEADLADNLKEFDVLVARHKNAKPEDLVQVLVMKAQLYIQVLDNPDKAIEVFKQIKKDFPTVPINGNTDQVIASLQAMSEKKKIHDALAPGATFPDFDEKDLEGKPLSIAKYKGKVVLVDFWATWCMPCVRELPAVLQAYDKFHDRGFEIIGVSLDEDKERLEQFIKQKKMLWPEYFDGKHWETKLAVKYGISAIPTGYLIGRDGKIIMKITGGEQLEPAIEKALSK